MVKHPCKNRHGESHIKKTKSFTVTIPVGVDSGNRICLSGEGEASLNGAPARDLYV